MRGITMAAVVAATALGLPGAIASGQETSGGTEPSYHEHLDGYFRRLTQFGFSGSVLVGSADAPEFVPRRAARQAGGHRRPTSATPCWPWWSRTPRESTTRAFSTGTSWDRPRMYRTGYLRPGYRDEELATGYRGEGALEAVIRQPMLPDGPTWNLRGNGGLHSDPYDIYRWFQALRRGEVLRAATVDEMTRGRVELPGGGGSYGYGFELARTGRGTRDVSHSGGNGYFAADFHWFPTRTGCSSSP